MRVLPLLILLPVVTLLASAFHSFARLSLSKRPPKTPTELGRLDAVPRLSLIDLDPEVARVQQLLFELEVQTLPEIQPDRGGGVEVPAVERLEAFVVRL